MASILLLAGGMQRPAKRQRVAADPFASIDRIAADRLRGMLQAESGFVKTEKMLDEIRKTLLGDDAASSEDRQTRSDRIDELVALIETEHSTRREAFVKDLRLIMPLAEAFASTPSGKYIAQKGPFMEAFLQAGPLPQKEEYPIMPSFADVVAEEDAAVPGEPQAEGRLRRLIALDQAMTDSFGTITTILMKLHKALEEGSYAESIQEKWKGLFRLIREQRTTQLRKFEPELWRLSGQ